MKDSSNEKNKSGIGLVFWLIVIITLLIAFLVCRDNIMIVLKETKFFTHVFGKEPEFVENYEIPENKKNNEDETIIILSPQEQLAESIKNNQTIIETPLSPNPEVITENQNIITKTEQETPVKEESSTEETKKETIIKEAESIEKTPVEIANTNQHLFFVFVNADGTVTRKESIRSIPKTMTPLSASLKALLNGPNLEERDKGFMSFIPQGTQLLSVSIQGETAMVNFSEEFLFNQYGVEGYLAQLMQVVFTATTFNTIKDAQILIEGEQTSYLGNDGVWIGSPLSRQDFK